MFGVSQTLWLHVAPKYPDWQMHDHPCAADAFRMHSPVALHGDVWHGAYHVSESAVAITA